MKVDMVMPQMGESIAEATISKWRKNVGDVVEKDEIILEISTDKVDSEIPSPASGRLVEVLFAEGAVVPVKTKIALIDSEAGAASVSAKTTAAPAATPRANSNGSGAASKPGSSTMGGASGGLGMAEVETDDTDRFFSPLVKNLADKHGVSLSELGNIQGTGQGGRINKTDFLNYISNRDTGGVRSSSPLPKQISQPQPAPAKAGSGAIAPSAMPSLDWADDGTKIVPMDNMRQAIAEHMIRSKHTSAHVYSMTEVDCSRISKYRELHKDKFKSAEGFGLSFTPFFLEAAVKGLLQFPYVNCSIDGKRIILKKHVNLGCAVALGTSGLIVPVIKRAEEKNFVGIARSLNDLALRARNKKLLPDEVVGGTFTVTNPGVFGTIIGTPIINQPQVAILCLGAIKKRPVVIDDMIAIREMCFLTLSYDHRIIDGSMGGQYLAFVRDYIENWDLDRPII